MIGKNCIVDCICKKSRDMDNLNDIIPTTRVYKKSSASGKLTCYIGYRELYSDVSVRSAAPSSSSSSHPLGIVGDEENNDDVLEGAILINDCCGGSAGAADSPPDFLSSLHSSAVDMSAYTVHLTLQAILRFGIPNRRSTATISSSSKKSKKHNFQRTGGGSAHEQHLRIIATNHAHQPQHHHHHHHFDSSIVLYSQNLRISFAEPCNTNQLSLLQHRLLRKLGKSARPFAFKLKPNTPFTSQTILRNGSKRCLAAVDYELKVSLGFAHYQPTTSLIVVDSLSPPVLLQQRPTSQPSLEHFFGSKRNSLRLSIRKLAVANPTPIQTSAPLNVECTLDKSLFYHDEKWINVNVNIANNSNRSVKSITIELVQYSQVFVPRTSGANEGYENRVLNVIPGTSRFKSIVSRTVDSASNSSGFPITPCATFSRVYSLPFGVNVQLSPTADGQFRSGGMNVVTLDGPPYVANTFLAASTIAPVVDENGDDMTAVTIDQLSPISGIVVKYFVRLKLSVSMSGDVILTLPVHITHRPTRRLLATCPVHHKHQHHRSSMLPLNASALIPTAAAAAATTTLTTNDSDSDLIKFESEDDNMSCTSSSSSSSGNEREHKTELDETFANNDQKKKEDDHHPIPSLEHFARLRLNQGS